MQVSESQIRSNYSIFEGSLSHSSLIDQFYDGLDQAQIRLAGQPQYTMSGDGSYFFGIYTTSEAITEDTNLMLGLFNSYAKSAEPTLYFGAHVAGGVGGFFDAKEQTEKHTIDYMLSCILGRLDGPIDMFKRFHNHHLTPEQVNDLTVRLCLNYSAITKGQIVDVVNRIVWNANTNEPVSLFDYWWAACKTMERQRERAGNVFAKRSIQLAQALEEELKKEPSLTLSAGSYAYLN